VSEKQTQNAILALIGSRTDTRLWRHSVGVARTPDGSVIRFGMPGQADLSGITDPFGRRLEIEVKSKTGRLRKEQIAFLRMVNRFGGIGFAARDAEEANRVLDFARSVSIKAWRQVTEEDLFCSTVIS
jgi:hypothetical protein